jgi:hypothetical protein
VTNMKTVVIFVMRDVAKADIGLTCPMVRLCGSTFAATALVRHQPRSTRVNVVARLVVELAGLIFVLSRHWSKGQSGQ